MGKNNIIELISNKTGFSKKDSRLFLNTFLGIIGNELSLGENVALADFGKFTVKQIAERQGVNPQTGEKMMIPQHKKVHFSPYENIMLYSTKF